MSDKNSPKVCQKIFAYLLKQCPHSQQMAKCVATSQKKWVGRDSPAFHELKETYQSDTYPIILYKGKLVEGGYETFSKNSSKYACKCPPKL